MMRIGILTGGGDCPGLNAVIRAVVKKAEKDGDFVFGIKNGWAGLVQGLIEPLTDFSVSGILPKGGTILGTSRTNPFKSQESVQRAMTNFKRFGLDALIAVGGNDTLDVAKKFHEMGLPIVGVPKTIDNDLTGTDCTFGFDTAISIVTEAIDRLHSTAESHQRVMVVEVMGRQAGWIATMAGIAGGADYVVVPEIPYDIEEICRLILHRKAKGKNFSIIVVAEGARSKDTGQVVMQDSTTDEFGNVRLGGVGNVIGREIEKRTGIETRVTILGHTQRGGSPTPYDRILATRYGLKAVELVREKKFGRMVALSGMNIVDVSLSESAMKMRTIDMQIYRDAETFFG
jgi:6-phosphofructokinase 1